ncbi:MAG: hypothetical protein JW804_05805 [Sedimentisphaerales bacterium]|nr:hypothetical protein [Sedimentisphaerales bacterium]
MNLKEYVKKSLIDITEGVFDAKNQAPLSIAQGIVEGIKITAPQYVSFEVMITINKEGGGEISVLSFGAKGGMSSQNVNKITFQVPVYFNAKGR